MIRLRRQLGDDGYATVATRNAALPDGERMAVVAMRKSVAG